MKRYLESVFPLHVDAGSYREYRLGKHIQRECFGFRSKRSIIKSVAVFRQPSPNTRLTKVCKSSGLSFAATNSAASLPQAALANGLTQVN